MVAQIFPEASQGQLLGLLQLLIALAIALALAIVAITVVAYPRSAARSGEEVRLQEVAPGEEAPARRPTASNAADRILWLLDKAEAVPIETLKQQLSDYEEVLGDAVRYLVERGLAQLSGGMLILSERGRKLLELAREKQVG